MDKYEKLNKLYLEMLEINAKNLLIEIDEYLLIRFNLELTNLFFGNGEKRCKIHEKIIKISDKNEEKFNDKDLILIYKLKYQIEKLKWEKF